MQQASQPRAPRQSDESSDESPSRRQVRQVVQHPEPSQDQLRERAAQHPASR
jgi:hypothetical protein